MSTRNPWSMAVLVLGAIVAGCAEREESAEELIVAVAVPEIVPVAAPAAPAVEVRPAGEAGEAPLPSEGRALTPVEEGAPPADLVLALAPGADGVQRLKLKRAGQLVMLRQGGQRAVGMGSAEIAPGGAAKGPIVWETTRPETLATIRGVVRLDGGAARLLLAEPPAEAASEAKNRHDCRGFHDGEGGFSVVCRVQTIASAASLGADAGEGVFVQVGDPTLVRFDLPLAEDGVAARALGYVSAGSGVVMRAEESRLPGEAQASLALLSAERAQPVPMPRFRHRHPPRRPPHREFDLVF